MNVVGAHTASSIPRPTNERNRRSVRSGLADRQTAETRHRAGSRPARTRIVTGRVPINLAISSSHTPSDRLTIVRRERRKRLGVEHHEHEGFASGAGLTREAGAGPAVNALPPPPAPTTAGSAIDPAGLRRDVGRRNQSRDDLQRSHGPTEVEVAQPTWPGDGRRRVNRRPKPPHRRVRAIVGDATTGIFESVRTGRIIVCGRDVARIDLGAEDYSSFLGFNGNRRAVGLGVLQLPTANALNVAEAVESKMTELSKSFPAGVHYEIAFDTTTFVRASIRDVVVTLLIAIVLVILVIYLFLQDWRTTLIPACTIPISLIGTFAFMKAFGFTINTITLFGLTLATGLVVDDAIVVIENISRFIQEKKMDPYAGAAGAMEEITSAVVASSLVLLAVFIPVAFFPGTTGLLYKQFALTIAAAITISLFNSLTLTPAFSALLLGHEESDAAGVLRRRRPDHPREPQRVSSRLDPGNARRAQSCCCSSRSA